MDRQLRAAIRAYVSDPSDDNAHRLAALAVRALSSDPEPQAPAVVSVRNIGANRTQLQRSDGSYVLVSYETPVAILTPEEDLYRVDSTTRTTAKHITQWARDMVPRAVYRVPQDQIQEMLRDA